MTPLFKGIQRAACVRRKARFAKAREIAEQEEVSNG
jgi:hypothetical protein